MKDEKLLTKKTIIYVICGALIIGGLGLSLIQSQASSAKKGIDTAKATAIALENAGIKQEDTVKLVSKYDYEDGNQIYEVSFYANDFEYDYHIAASDGIILEAKREMMDSEDYKEAGLENPNAKKEEKKESTKDTSSKKASQSQQPAASQQSAETKKSNEPQQSTGSNQSTAPKQSSQTTQSSDSSGYISTDKAKSIALNKAGISSNNATFTKAKLDKDDGIYVYEIEFISGSYEYDVEINATSGRVLDFDIDDIEYDDDRYDD